MIHHPFARWHIFRRVIFGVLSIFLIGCVAACGTTTTVIVYVTPNPPPAGTLTLKPCPQPMIADTQPGPYAEARFWQRDTIAVSAVLSQSSVRPQDFLSQLNAAVFAPGSNQQFAFATSTDKQLPEFIRVGNAATAFLTMQNSYLNCDDNIKSAVTTINAPFATGAAPVQFAGGVIAGASPDWLLASSYDAGNDGIHGSPGGVPVPTSQQPKQGPSGKSAGNGNTAVFILDTGYQVSGGAQPAAICGDHSCVPAATPLDLSGSGVASPLATNLQPALQESDMQLPDESSFEDFGSSMAINVQEHGLFIGELAHWLAPAAQIRLVRILNDYGAGDLQSLTLALSSIENDMGQFHLQGQPSKFIINLSLDFGPSFSCVQQFWDNWLDERDAPPITFNASRQGGPHLYNTTSCNNRATDANAFMKDAGLYSTVGQVLHALASDKRFIIVAAAGNDNHDFAHLPAAFCDVIAAGATPGTTPPTNINDPTQLADFSDLPFLPGQSCIGISSNPSSLAPTLVSGQARYAYAGGVNLCSLYRTTAPSNDLASWSGTSFASGIISGNLANSSASAPASSGMVPVANQDGPCQ